MTLCRARKPAAPSSDATVDHQPLGVAYFVDCSDPAGGVGAVRSNPLHLPFLPHHRRPLPVLQNDVLLEPNYARAADYRLQDKSARRSTAAFCRRPFHILDNRPSVSTAEMRPTEKGWAKAVDHRFVYFHLVSQLALCSMPVLPIMTLHDNNPLW